MSQAFCILRCSLEASKHTDILTLVSYDCKLPIALCNRDKFWYFCMLTSELSNVVTDVSYDCKVPITVCNKDKWYWSFLHTSMLCGGFKNTDVLTLVSYGCKLLIELCNRDKYYWNFCVLPSWLTITFTVASYDCKVLITVCNRDKWYWSFLRTSMLCGGFKRHWRYYSCKLQLYIVYNPGQRMLWKPQ